uniref:Uncharacterized protein n=1 Tax=viral metagenome TaxID=1070528 RepID=A0A6M3JJE6_9ZZZZ
MNQYILLHTHEFGPSVYRFRSKLELEELDPRTVASVLMVNFEGWRGESLLIAELLSGNPIL